ncbi:hypothetical protein IJU97_00060 [bacterium]|nr:hypothetical protein [bacterium]
MVAGTFNLVIAQRLCRNICPNCKTTTNVQADPRYQNALETFKEFDRDALKDELMSRGITGQEWSTFIKDGIIAI